MHNSNFVRGGRRRARKGIERELRSQVEGKYAEEWNASGIFRRLLLWRRIGREVKAGAAAKAYQAPPDALY